MFRRFIRDDSLDLEWSPDVIESGFSRLTRCHEHNVGRALLPVFYESAIHRRAGVPVLHEIFCTLRVAKTRLLKLNGFQPGLKVVLFFGGQTGVALQFEEPAVSASNDDRTDDGLFRTAKFDGMTFRTAYGD